MQHSLAERRTGPTDSRVDHPARWHALDPEEVLSAMGSDARRGLSTDEATERIERVGPNALPKAARRSLLAVFLGQFRSPLIYLLLAAAAVAGVLGHVGDCIVILSVVLLNSIIGAVQEGRAEHSLDALRKLSAQKTRVVRGGKEIVVAAADVVPGDVIVLDAGDAVAADARLLDGAALQIAEAALTGESVPVFKSLSVLADETALADRRNMVYAGTYVTAGRARALVVATGLETEIGKIARLAESAEVPETPLERRVAEFGRYLAYAAAVLFVVLVAVGLLRGMPFGSIVMLGISQVVGMVPEGLPVAMTIALAAGVQRMARRKAVVRRLGAVETLGSTTVICSDKTGTLTRNEMTVTAAWLPGAGELTVTGVGYEPAGAFMDGEQRLDPARLDDLREVLEACVLCNDAQLQGPEDTEPRWKPTGDPTEVALVTLAIKGGVLPTEIRERLPRRAEIPFDPATKLMATQHETPDGPLVILKGAPEMLLELAVTERAHGRDVHLTEELRQSARLASERMARGALRVLAVGVVRGGEVDGTAGFAAFSGRVTLLGLLGQLDPPRTEVAEAVRRCLAAGIRPVMVTGDHKETGQAIARALGIARDGDAAIDGRELERLTNDELAAQIENISVFARVHPAQKLRIVGAYQRRGDVVAMTGDGVNDAPALAKADVGVAMGITGTEVAKEAAKIVVTDDNFASIVAAIEEGRVVYGNIKKAVLLLFSTSVAEVLVLLLALLAGYPAPFVAVQILWNNLVTEGLVTVNLVMDPPEGDEMSRRPVSAKERLLDPVLLSRMAVMTPVIVAATLGWFILRTNAGVPEAQVRTETFTLLAICEWFNVLNCRSETRSALNLSLFANRWLLGGLLLGILLQVAVVFWTPLGEWFHTVPFGAGIGISLCLVGSSVLWVEELRKAVVRRRMSAMVTP